MHIISYTALARGNYGLRCSIFLVRIGFALQLWWYIFKLDTEVLARRKKEDYCGGSFSMLSFGASGRSATTVFLRVNLSQPGLFGAKLCIWHLCGSSLIRSFQECLVDIERDWGALLYRLSVRLRTSCPPCNLRFYWYITFLKNYFWIETYKYWTTATGTSYLFCFWLLNLLPKVYEVNSGFIFLPFFLQSHTNICIAYLFAFIWLHLN